MRTLKYFGIQAEKLVAFDILMGFAYGIIFGTLLSDRKDDWIVMTVNYLFILGVITIIVAQSNLVKINMPLALSMGARRKEVFWGAQWTMALLIVQLLILIFLAKVILPQSYMKDTGFVSIFLLYICIFGAVLSELLAIMSLKFGNKGTIIGAVCMSLAGTFSILTVADFDIFSYTPSNSFKALLFLILIMLYAVITAIYYYIWKKYELRTF